jgi:hypothetical protein
MVPWLHPQNMQIICSCWPWLLLFTIMAHSNITNKGVPAGFFITNMESTAVISEWLLRVRNNHNLNVKRIMIDCSPTEIPAIAVSQLCLGFRFYCAIGILNVHGIPILLLMYCKLIFFNNTLIFTLFKYLW